MSEAALRADIPPHFSKDSPCWAIYSELHGIHAKLQEIGAAKTHSMCVAALAPRRRARMHRADCSPYPSMRAHHIFTSSARTWRTTGRRVSRAWRAVRDAR